ncbi:MAG: amidohydrolase family protein [Dehalococcoidia bacterium]
MTQSPPQLLLRNARLFDGTGAPPLSGIDLLIEGERIVAAGRGLAGREGAEVVDLDGRTVLPGLIDCHVHIAFDGDPDETAKLATMPAPVLAWHAAENARRTLEAGITAVRDVGSRDNIAILLRDEIRAGRLPGPEMRAAGALICMTGGHGWMIGREADGADDVRKAVREQRRAGADCIKFTATGGVMTPGIDPRASSFTEEELRAGVDEAHKAFVRTAAHAQGTSGIKNAVRAGVDSIEHGIYLDDEAIAMMRERGTVLVATLAAPLNIGKHGLAAGIPAYAVEKSNQVMEAHRESFKLAYRSGVRIAMGTDAGTPFNRHGANADEIAMMVECGMTPADALVAATRAAAELLDLLDDCGTVEPGKRADLVIVDGDPLADIRLLCRPDTALSVVKGGRWVRRTPALDRSVSSGVDVARPSV